MKMYSVEEAFEILKAYKITTHMESVRRWLRNGTIQGEAPLSRKEGWRISEDALYSFIRDRTPDQAFDSNKTTNVVKEEIKEKARAEMWWEIVRKNIFEDYIELKKTRLQECVQHKGYSKAFEKQLWEEVSQHTRGYSTPRIPYLLDAFLYNNERILMEQDFEEKEECILFALLEHVRKKRTQK
ncbi:hypothetical protein [Bacillus piscicola]|uniref:hypothetical protein n=1 Tax=Bacillus piscicola TaxID=1632684 RepID=UPI001F091AF7|nr:hypothetical protein [Bacillus piscicola]